MLKEGRERKSEKSPGKSPAPSRRHLSFPVPLTHLTDFQSPEPICWERNPTLARNETTSTPRHTPTPQHRLSPPLHPLLCSPLSPVSRHIKGLEEKLARSPICSPTLHFVLRPHSWASCANCESERRKERVNVRGRMILCCNGITRNRGIAQVEALIL